MSTRNPSNLSRVGAVVLLRLASDSDDRRRLGDLLAEDVALEEVGHRVLDLVTDELPCRNREDLW